MLESLFGGSKDPLRLSPLLQAPTGQILDAVHKLGLEGVVGKQSDSGYVGQPQSPRLSLGRPLLPSLRARGKSHASALRSLGQRWLKIL